MNALLATVEPPGSGAVAREAATLAQALRFLGHRVATIIPHYGPPGGGEFPAGAEGACGFQWEGEEFVLSKTRRRGAADLIHLWHRDFGPPTAFYSIDTPEAGTAARRCTLFCRGAVEAARRLKPSPQVILPLDWPPALIPVLLRQDRLPLGCVIPVVDPRHHGLLDGGLFSLLRLDYRWFEPGVGEFFGKFSFLKAGLATCDRILVRGGRVHYDLCNNPSEPLAGVFRSLSGKTRLFAAPALARPGASLSSEIKAAALTLPASWRKGGTREKQPILALCALDSACLMAAIDAARLLATVGWNILLQIPAPLRRDSAVIEINQPADGVAVTPPELSDEELFAVSDAAFFCSESFRDATAITTSASLGAWPVPIRRPHLVEALDLALSPETVAEGDPPRFTFDHATPEALVDAARALLPRFAVRGRSAKTVAAAAARSAEFHLARCGDPIALHVPTPRGRRDA